MMVTVTDKSPTPRCAHPRCDQPFVVYLVIENGHGKDPDVVKVCQVHHDQAIEMFERLRA